MRVKPKQIFPYHLILLSFAALMFLNIQGNAQLKPFPLPQKKSATKATTRSTGSNARTKEIIPKKLPFWDDFSANPVDDTTILNANYPVDSLWINNYTVWINSGMAINPPSVNTATFDGLDSAFLPYSAQVLVNGLRDSLVSQHILLGESNVSVAERSSVYLSFFYQWQGNGEAPDALDYIRVQFKNNTGEWESVMTIYPKTSFDRTEFYDTLMLVDGDRFFHDAFQFRFLNYGRQSGPYDTWNIDYVYLNKNRSIADTDFPDQAATSTLTGLFGGFQSVPYEHFITNNALSAPTFGVFNGLNDYTDLTYLTEGTFFNWLDGVVTETFISNLGGNDTSAINADGSGIIFPLERRTVTLEYLPDASDVNQFDPVSDSVLFKLKVKLFTGDTFDPKTGDFANDYNLNYRPIDFRVNDTIHGSYVLKDYYAYDDGIAEYAAGLTQAGNRAALLFEMLPSAKDTLVGIDIYVPDYGLVSNLTVDFYVYNDEGGQPGDIIYSIPSFSIQRKGLNKFQRIRILEPFLVDQRFYIGWKAPVGGILKIGLDYNNNSGDKTFVNTNGSWTQDADITGSLMIRPVFGTGDVIVGIPETQADFSIYPNPNNGEFYLQGNFDSLDVINSTGQSVPFTIQPVGNDHKINLQHMRSGFYILKVQTGNKIKTGKVIVK